LKALKNERCGLQKWAESLLKHIAEADRRAAVSAEDLKNITITHSECVNTLNRKLDVLEKDLTTTTYCKNSLENHLQQARYNLKNKDTQLEGFKRLKEKSKVNCDSFKRRIDNLRTEIMKIEETVASLQAEKGK